MDQKECSSIGTVAEICDIVGRTQIASAVGVGMTAVSNAVVENRFPARWYLAVRRLCDEARIACPEALFSFVEIEGAA